MRKSPAFALILLWLGTIVAAAPELVPLSIVHLKSDAEEFGGFSGLEISDDGSSMTAISDTGLIYRFDILRTGDGSITHIHTHPGTKLFMERGTQPDEKKYRDTEGLAIAPNGDVFIAAESISRLLRYPSGGDIPSASDLPPLASKAPSNAGYEALAIAPDGALITLAESSGSLTTPFRIMRRDESSDWRSIYELKRGGGFKPVGADFGPDGNLYILSRAFSGFSFAARIDQLVIDGSRVVEQNRLFSGYYGQFDNLEGLAIWRDSRQKLRAVAISDDNFSTLQRSLLIEFELKE